jgi:hypothetical protein
LRADLRRVAADAALRLDDRFPDFRAAFLLAMLASWYAWSTSIRQTSARRKANSTTGAAADFPHPSPYHAIGLPSSIRIEELDGLRTCSVTLAGLFFLIRDTAGATLFVNHR